MYLFSSLIRYILIVIVLGYVLFSVAPAQAYPLDGYDYTGIKRLEFYRLAQTGQLRGRKQPIGGTLRSEQIRPGGHIDTPWQLPGANTELNRQLTGLIPSRDRGRYGVALIDFSDPSQLHYAEHNGGYHSNVGSVGKMVAAVALFQQLADLYPHDLEAREALLRQTQVKADRYSVSDPHKVPLFNVERRRLSYRPLRPGDTGSLWDFLDWTMSASSNAAASMIMKETVAITALGQRYRDPAAYREFFRSSNTRQRGQYLAQAMDHAAQRNGIDGDKLRQGSLFTRGGKGLIGGRRSYGTPRELARLLMLMENGQLVDQWSSRELKRLLYMTQRRIRYASHPAMADAAIYFKSGSLYSCAPEPGFVCRKYRGNRRNVLASVALVEWPAEQPKLRYGVAVVSNVLRKNSAVAHQTLALRIHRWLQSHHGTGQDAGDVLLSNR